MASTINTLGDALYKVFCASSDPSRNGMRQACFDYLSFGGVFTNGPIALLSGVNPHPLSLVVHFFAAAVFGVGCLLLPFPLPKRMLIGARLNSVSLVLETSIYTLPGLNDFYHFVNYDEYSFFLSNDILFPTFSRVHQALFYPL